MHSAGMRAQARRSSPTRRPTSRQAGPLRNRTLLQLIRSAPCVQRYWRSAVDARGSVATDASVRPQRRVGRQLDSHRVRDETDAVATDLTRAAVGVRAASRALSAVAHEGRMAFGRRGAGDRGLNVIARLVDARDAALCRVDETRASGSIHAVDPTIRASALRVRFASTHVEKVRRDVVTRRAGLVGSGATRRDDAQEEGRERRNHEPGVFHTCLRSE